MTEANPQQQLLGLVLLILSFLMGSGVGALLAALFIRS